MSEQQETYITYRTNARTGQTEQVELTRHQFLCERYGLSESLSVEEVEAHHAQAQADADDAQTVIEVAQSAKDLALGRLRAVVDVADLTDAQFRALVADIVEVLR